MFCIDATELCQGMIIGNKYIACCDWRQFWYAFVILGDSCVGAFLVLFQVWLSLVLLDHGSDLGLMAALTRWKVKVSDKFNPAHIRVWIWGKIKIWNMAVWMVLIVASVDYSWIEKHLPSNATSQHYLWYVEVALLCFPYGCKSLLFQQEDLVETLCFIVDIKFTLAMWVTCGFWWGWV